MPDFTFSESDQALFGVPYSRTASRFIVEHERPARTRRARTPRQPAGPNTAASIRALLTTNDKALERGILVIHERQTASERSTRQTNEHNGRGFTGVDAEFLSSLAEWILASRRVAGMRLTIGQRMHARRKMLKYSGQLAIVANEKWRAANPVVAVAPVVEQVPAHVACSLCDGSGRYENPANEFEETSCPNGCTI